jgi:hypothetical protein
MSNDTKPWPVRDDYHPLHVGDVPYERARADAWESRCRVAVEALGIIEGGSNCDACDGLSRIAAEALARIGELPPCS